MRSYEDDCVGPCPMGCMGPACPHRNRLVCTCDKCREEVDELFCEDAGNEVCFDCLKESCTVIELDECDDSRCDYCGDGYLEGVERLYRVDNELMCEECLEKERRIEVD